MRSAAVMLLLASWSLLGCQTPPPPAPGGYQTVAQDPARDTDQARQENAAGIECLKEGQWDKAQEHLKAALAADLFFGPAHNNLGMAYFQQKKFYLAAWEYQYAAQLMADDPRPRNNLGLVFESIGQNDKAAASYDEAMNLAPDNPEFIGNLARVYARTGKDPKKLRQLLTDLTLRETRPQWAQWAHEKLALLGGPVESTESTSQPAEQP